MSDDLYYTFRSKWLGKWHTARYQCTLAELEERFAPGEYEIIGPGERRFNPYGPSGNMYDWSGVRGMLWERAQGKPPSDDT